MNIIEYILTNITNITSLILINNRLWEVISKNHIGKMSLIMKNSYK